ncbi:MAG TPA: glycosyltransferase [Solirubrobacterales bacterium]|jgi:glycosyltransferase involved in cell wall biosynthesis|nr:glycosyltransferase [Solirubrobacterales bacterium]
MRILLIASMIPDAEGVGAIPKLLHAQLVGLRERHEITLVAPVGEDPGQAAAAERLAGSELDAHFADRRRSRSARRRWRVRAELAGTWTLKDWPWRVVSGSGGVQPLVDRLLATREFDVIAVEDNPMSMLRFPASLPTVLTEHEAVRADAGEWGSPRLAERPLAALRARDWRRWSSFLPQAWRRFDLVQVFSESDARAVAEQAPDLAARIRINPYGIVLPPAADPAAEVPGTILFAGTFSHLPNRDAARWLAREIMPVVLAEAPRAQLRIVGSSPPREVLDLAGPGIEVIADAPSVEPHLDAAAVVIAPVRSGGGMRMKVLEPLARGKAVVTTPLGAEGFTGFEQELPFAVADDAAGIAAATVALLADDRRRRELAARARDFAERHHSPAAWAARLETVYEEARSRDLASRPQSGIS